MVNLVVELDGEHFGKRALTRALSAIERAGYTVERSNGDGRFLAWIDDQFGGTWSSEACAGTSVIARRGGDLAGFAAYDPRGLTFSWLRGLGAEKDVGIFGPFGVSAAHRGTDLGPNLLLAALASLREAGYARALIPAVGHEKLVAYYAKFGRGRVAEQFDRSPWRDRVHRAVLLASGNGSNVQAVLDAVAAKRLPLDVRLVLCNTPGAHVMERARAANVPTACLPWDRARETRDAYDARLAQTVRRESPDLVLLLGWMHLLDERFVTEFPELLNVHPAFLPLDPACDDVTFPDGSTAPAFRGARAVRDALRWGSRWTGATVHRVMLDTDRGPVLVRKPVALLPGDTEDAALARLHPTEHRLVSGAIMRWVYERP